MFFLLSPPALSAEPSEDRAALAEATLAWGSRDRPGVAERTIATLQAFEQTHPDDYEVHWQLARFWHALSLRGDKPPAQTAYTGVAPAEKATALNPSGVEGWFWLASTLGTYAEHSGIMDAVRQGLAGRIESAAKRAVSLNGSYDHGAPLVALGQYYAALPWPLQDLPKARTLLERAVAQGPKYALNLYYLAELEMKEEKYDAARALYERILALGSTEGDPPATRRYKPLARARIPELDAL